MRQFATLQEYRDWSGDQAAELSTGQLLSASLLVSMATRGAMYDTNSLTLMPTDAGVLTALRDATCAVLQHRHGDSSSEEAQAAVALRAAGLESASLGTSTYKLASGSTSSTPDPNAPDLPWLAHAILAEAGLVGGVVGVYG